MSKKGDEEQKGDDQKSEGKKGQAKAPKEVSKMNAGDYTLHLLIQKAKDLDIPGDEDKNVNVEVTVQSKKETTKELKGVTATTVCEFDSHIFVELMGQSASQLEQTKILIKLQEKGYFKSQPIGQVELDLTYVYNMENHTQQHSWVALINPDSEDFSSVAAYLKFSVSVYGVDDSPVELKMDENDDDENCIMPASIKPKYTQLKMHIVKGEKLPRLDVALIGKGSMDAYVSAKIGGKTIKTKIEKTEDDAATWNQTFLIPVRMPIMSGKLILNVMDYDTVNDEQAGALIFNFKELLQRGQKSFFWANVYGAPGQEGMIASGSDLADEMNKDPTKATKWKGRVLIGIEHEETEAPRLGVEAMETKPPCDEEGNEIPGARSIVEIAKDFMKPVKYKIMYEFDTCMNIPEHCEGFNLQLAIAENVWTTQSDENKRAVGYNYNRWAQRSDLIEFEAPYSCVADFGEIFLYLCPDKGGLGGVFGGKKANQADNPISYVKLRAEDFEHDVNPKLRWEELLPEPIENEVKSPEMAGIVGFRLSIIRADSGVDLKAQENWKKRLKMRAESAKIRCYLFQCRDLPAADEEGASDPVVVAYNTVQKDSKKERMLKEVQESVVIEQNCDPMFYQLMELKIDYTKGEALPPFIFDVYDVDKCFVGADDRDFIGRAYIDLEDSAHKKITQAEDSEDLRPEIPKWHPLRFQKGGPKQGEILVSFIITEEFDHEWVVPNEAVKMMGIKDDSAVVRFDEYQVELNVLGLRGLVSPGLLPVKKAYIDFLLSSMVPPIAASALQTISTSPGPSGSDPTINAVISFTVPMPVNPLFAPSMSCKVYDKVFKGFSGQLIGVFSIPMGQIMLDQEEEYKENNKNLDDIISELKKVLSGEAVLDYDGKQANIDVKAVDDKAFRQQQRKEKEQIQKAMEKPAKLPVEPEEKKSFSDMLADRIAPEPEKPTTALQKKLQQKKNTQMKSRLLVHVDDDSDSEGEQYTNPVAKNDTEKLKYVPPQIDLGAINDSRVSALDALAGTPRSQLSDSEKRQVDQEAVLEALAEKEDPDMLKKVTPKKGEVFKPPAGTRISHQDVEDVISRHSGAGTPISGNRSIKSFNSAKSGTTKLLMDFHNEEQAAIKREAEAQRQKALKEMEATGIKEVKMIQKPVYELDKRLNCMKEVNEPPAILFEPLGWDRDRENPGEKHYRKLYNDELEDVKEVMSRPSEFNSYVLKRGQSRGASKSFFGSSKKDETGNEDTTQEMGKFKSLITIAHKETFEQKKMVQLEKLARIRSLLAEIYTKKFNKPFPVAEGFFCETTIHGSKVMTAVQRERAYSDDIKSPDDSFKRKAEVALSTRSNKTFVFDDKASTIMNQEGRSMFKELMRAMKLTHLQILRKVVDVQSDEIIKRLLMVETKCFIRCYIVRAINLAARDNDSPSDPYVKVILGEQEFSDRDNYKEDEASPDIYKLFKFQAVFPGCPLLKVQFWDYDLLFGDDFIGETQVDLEDRYFSSDFKSFQHKPIEIRNLRHPSTEMSQGQVVMWAEINDQAAPADTCPEYDISKKPTEDFEVRVIVWDTEELKMMDCEGTTDGFVRCFFDSEDRRDTDTHFRNQDGKCSWNYRILFPFTYPSKNYKLTVQAYDLDLFKSNDLIGQTTIDLQDIFDDSELTKRQMSLTKDYYEQYLQPEQGWKGLEFVKDEPNQFWVELMAKDENGKQVSNGRLKLQIDIVPKKDAEANPVGAAQSEPNINPFLPKPFGRIEFSINPFKMLNQLIGPALRRKIYCACCVIVCCALCVMMAPMIISNMFVNLITPG